MNKDRKLISIALILFWGLIVYSNTFHCPFQLDDYRALINNPFIRNISDLQNIWSFYPCRFITFLSIAFNYYCHRLDVLGYHLFNIAVHLGSAILVWRFTLLTLSTPAMKEDKITPHAGLIALLAGLVFVSHPVQVEAVTYIYQRAASMMALFYLASLSFYAESRILQVEEPASEFIALYYICSLIFTVAAMFTKENSITLPLMILFYEFSFFGAKRDFNWKHIAPFLLALFIIPLTMLLTKSKMFGVLQAITAGPHGISPWHYLLTQFRVMVTYIRLLFLPVNQNFDYDYPVFKDIFELPVLASLSFLMIVLWWAKHLFSKHRLVSFSIIWFFLTLLPESSILPAQDVIFEHRLYLPMVGYSIFLVSGVYYLWGKNNIKTMVIALMMIIACNSVLTYQRNMVWKDELTLWNDVVKKSPHKARPYNSLGAFYGKQGDLAQALFNLNKAIEIDPDRAEAYCDRGLILGRQGNFTQAMSDLDKAIKIDPSNVEAYIDRGAFYAQQGEIPQAFSDYKKAIDLNPGFAEIYSDRAILYFQLKEYDQAWDDVDRVEALGGAVNQGFIKALKGVSPNDESSM